MRTVPVSRATAKLALEFVRLRPSMRLDARGFRTVEQIIAAHVGELGFNAAEFRRAFAARKLVEGATMAEVAGLLGVRRAASVRRILFAGDA